MVWREWHHGYLGIGLLGASWALGWPPLGLIGGLLVLDDAYQHLRQVGEPGYESPLHQLYGRYLWPLPWVRSLNRWLDRLFR
jgi:hypothetical protein